MANLRHFHPSDDDQGIFPAGNRGLDDDNSSWWEGTHLSFARFVAAAAVAASTFAGQLNSAPWTFEQNEIVPQPPTFTPDEDGWLPRVQSRQAFVLAITTDDEFVAIVDEDYWQPPARADKQVVIQPTVDEDFVPPPAAVLTVDEDGWIVVPLQKQATSQLAITVDDEIASSPLLVDEEHPRAVVLTPPPITYPPAFVVDDEIVPQPIPLPVDEEHPWRLAPPQVLVTYSSARTADDERVVPAAPLPIDELYGWATALRPIAPVITIRPNLPGLSQGNYNDEYAYPPSIQVEENEQPVIVRPWPKVPLRAITVDDEIVRPLLVDESDWSPPAPWVIRKSPIVVWWQDPAEQIAPLATLAAQCFPTVYVCGGATSAVLVCSTEDPTVCVDVVPTKQLVFDNSCLPAGTTVPYPLPPPPSVVPHHLIWLQQPVVDSEVGSASGVEPFLFPMQVAGVDADDNILVGFTAAVSISIGALDYIQGSLNGVTTKAAVAGIATFDGVTVNYFFGPGGPGSPCGIGPCAAYTLKASSSGVTDVESDMFSFGTPV